jgi:hypothetical protein
MEDGRLRVSCEAEFGQNLHEAKKKTSSNLSYPMFSGGEKNSCSVFVLSAIADFHFSRNTLIFLFLLDFTLQTRKGSLFLPRNLRLARKSL